MPYNSFASQGRWELDDNGFMRCTARILGCGVMRYRADEMGSTGEGMDPGTILDVMVPFETINDPYALRSLEGMPVVAFDHVWIEPGVDAGVVVGNVAGTPRIDGPWIVADLVVRDPKVIDAIQRGEISDISSAYIAVYSAEEGVYDGTEYGFRKDTLRFNHVAILPPGAGRGGRDIRIMNRKTEDIEDMADNLIAVQLAGAAGSVRVHPEDREALTNAITRVQNEAAEASAASGSQLEATLEEVMSLKAQLAEKTGELEALKEKLDAALAPEAVEAAANEMAEERDEAVETLVANGVEEDREKAMNSCAKLRGPALRRHVVEAVRTSNGLPALPEKTDDNVISGYYNSYREFKPAEKSRKAVPGATIVQNAAPQPRSNPFGYPRAKEGGK